MLRALATVALLASCAGAPPATDRSGDACRDHDFTPKGTQADYRLDASSLSGFRISPPLLCQNQHAYIRIERARGDRRLAIERSHRGAFDQGCRELPKDPKDPTDCPEINALTLMMEVYQRLGAAGIRRSGPGLGPCGSHTGDYEVWNMAVGVYDWNHAARAVRTTAEVMDEYDVQGFVGVAVLGTDCVVPLEGR